MDANGSVPDIAGNLTAIYHINRRAFQKGERKGITLAASEHYLFGLGQFCYRGVRRWDFEAMYAPGTYPLVNAILSVATA
jgi:hypothetical protein